jgi:hypothetical protein
MAGDDVAMTPSQSPSDAEVGGFCLIRGVVCERRACRDLSPGYCQEQEDRKTPGTDEVASPSSPQVKP